MPVHLIRRSKRRQRQAELRHTHLKNVQHFECGKALPWWRQLEHIVAVVVGRDRFDPFRLELRKIARVHHATVRLNFLNNRRRNLTLVERVSALLLHHAKRFR